MIASVLAICFVIFLSLPTAHHREKAHFQFEFSHIFTDIEIHDLNKQISSTQPSSHDDGHNNNADIFENLRPWHYVNYTKYTKQSRKDIAVAIHVFAWQRAKSLLRLLKSLEEADYGHKRHIPLIIHMDAGYTAAVDNVVNEWLWKYGEKRIIKAEISLGPLQMMLRINKDVMLDKKNLESYSIFLEDDVEVSPLFFTYAIWCAKNFLLADSSHTSAHIMGCSLYTPRLDEISPTLNPQNPPQWFPENILPPNTPLFMFQLPCSWGAIYSDQEWTRFVKFAEKRISSTTDGIFPLILNEARSNLWTHSWKKYLIEYMYLKALTLIYPSFPAQVSFSTNHYEQGVHSVSDGDIIQVPDIIREIPDERFTVPLFTRKDGEKIGKILDQYLRGKKTFVVVGLEHSTRRELFFPDYMTINPWVAALPFIIIIAITMAKDGLEDMRRHTSDGAMNAQITRTLNFPNANARFHAKNSDWKFNILNVWSFKSSCATVSPNPSGDKPAAWLETKWGDVKVGDVVLINSNDSIPADVLILTSSDSDGLCYVETKNLDGETNLKIRNSLLETAPITRDTFAKLLEYKFRVETENPNPNLYTFTGTAFFQGSDAKDQFPLNINSILLRGCTLRNTEWVIGLVLFTGKDTKICMNAGATPSKQSRIEKLMNPQMTSLIAFQNIVPISIYLTIEIVKTIQSKFIYDDFDMFYEPLNKSCIPKAWNLSDDLGQIDYIFSDKTGTLTRNIMQFKKCSINGVVYGDQESVSPIQPSNQCSISLTGIAKKNGALKIRRLLSEITRNSTMINSPAKNKVTFLTNLSSNNVNKISPTEDIGTSQTENLKFTDSVLLREISNISNSQYAPLRDFFTTLAVCHSVMISKDENSPENVKYNAQSPDEAALVNAARDMGFIFTTRTSSSIIVDVLGEDEECAILNAIEFNSTRKRMSVIVKRPAGEIVLYCKGADTVIYERLAPGQDQIKKITQSHLEEFAEDGLRTLCIAYTVLNLELYETWVEEYNIAATAIDDREQKMDAVAEKIEKNLILMGATAIEDKLQEGVPDCIQTLLAAKIKIWVLTGDKMETAINIGFSSNLLHRSMNLILIRGANNYGNDEAESTKRELAQALHCFFGVGEVTEEITKSRKYFKEVGKNNQNEQYALIIDGIALKYALQDDQKNLLIELGTRCAAVICCRVSPLQKAKVVELVKASVQSLCLAIGDGANDVSMIQAAHIGVGIAGEEGLQAVMASDYAICQFKYLTKLLIIYNVILTGTPVGFLGIFDIDIQQQWALLFPPLYKREAPLFSYQRFTLYMLDAVYQSASFFFLTIYACDGDTIDFSGRTWDLGDLGIFLSIMGAVIANTYVTISFNSWTWVSATLIALVMFILVVFSIVYAAMAGSLVPGILVVMYSRAVFWLSIPIQIIVCILPRVVMLYCFRQFNPTNLQIIQEKAKIEGGEVTLETKRISRALMERKTRHQTSQTSLYSHSLYSSEIFQPDQFPVSSSLAQEVPDPPHKDLQTDITSQDANGSTKTLLQNALLIDTRKVQSEFIMPHMDSTVSFKTLPRTMGGQHILQSEPRAPISMTKSSSIATSDEEEKGGMTLMRTGEIMRNRGFSFSQSPGARDVIMGRKRGTELSSVSPESKLFRVSILTRNNNNSDEMLYSSSGL
ncbi:hypothetical protein HK100_008266 [Physocladia obscura]|uniref:Phospholipid-transporting ATPase n=1 Tax=Physocladia obscura TaxID=109957 RepID=A0AAD5TCT3_9FUNG|nr:hypothetical protein HK100_008266 [Physocladia obscura]